MMQQGMVMSMKGRMVDVSKVKMSMNEKMMFWVLLAVLAAANLVGFILNVIRYQNALNNPVSTTETSLATSFPSVGLLLCLPPFSGFNGDFVESVKCRSRGVPQSDICGIPYREIEINGVQRTCYRVVIPGISKAEAEANVEGGISSWRASVNLTNLPEVPFLNRTVLVIPYSRAVGPPSSFVSAQFGSVLISGGQSSLLTLSLVSIDRTGIAEDSEDQFKLSMQDTSIGATPDDPNKPGPFQIELVVYPLMNIDFIVTKVKFRFDYGFYDLISSAAALLSITISVVAFFFPLVPLVPTPRLWLFNPVIEEVTEPHKGDVCDMSCPAQGDDADDESPFMDEVTSAVRKQAPAEWGGAAPAAGATERASRRKRDSTRSRKSGKTHKHRTKRTDGTGSGKRAGRSSVEMGTKQPAHSSSDSEPTMTVTFAEDSSGPDAGRRDRTDNTRRSAHANDTDNATKANGNRNSTAARAGKGKTRASAIKRPRRKHNY